MSFPNLLRFCQNNKIVVLCLIFILLIFSGCNNKVDTITGRAVEQSNEESTTTIEDSWEVQVTPESYMTGYEPSYYIPTTTTPSIRLVPKKGETITDITVNKEGDTYFIKDSADLRKEVSFVGLDFIPYGKKKVEYQIQSDSSIEVYFVPDAFDYTTFADREKVSEWFEYYKGCKTSWRRNLTGVCYIGKGGLLMASRHTSTNHIEYSLKISPTDHEVDQLYTR